MKKSSSFFLSFFPQKEEIKNLKEKATGRMLNCEQELSLALLPLLLPVPFLCHTFFFFYLKNFLIRSKKNIFILYSGIQLPGFCK